MLSSCVASLLWREGNGEIWEVNYSCEAISMHVQVIS